MITGYRYPARGLTDGNEGSPSRFLMGQQDPITEGAATPSSGSNLCLQRDGTVPSASGREQAGPDGPRGGSATDLQW